MVLLIKLFWPHEPLCGGLGSLFTWIMGIYYALEFDRLDYGLDVVWTDVMRIVCDDSIGLVVFWTKTRCPLGETLAATRFVTSLHVFMIKLHHFVAAMLIQPRVKRSTASPVGLSAEIVQKQRSFHRIQHLIFIGVSMHQIRPLWCWNRPTCMMQFEIADNTWSHLNVLLHWQSDSNWPPDSQSGRTVDSASLPRAVWAWTHTRRPARLPAVHRGGRSTRLTVYWPCLRRPAVWPFDPSTLGTLDSNMVCPDSRAQSAERRRHGEIAICCTVAPIGQRVWRVWRNKFADSETKLGMAAASQTFRDCVGSLKSLYTRSSTNCCANVRASNCQHFIMQPRRSWSFLYFEC